MAKFCKYCGKELEEGMICSCVENAEQEEKTIKNNDIKSHAKGFWALFKAFIKNPVSVGARFVNACDFKYALVLIGLQSILVALLVISLVGKFNSAIKNTIALAGSYAEAIESQVSGVMFSLPTVFIITAIATFAIASLLALILMLFIKLFKGNTTYKYMLCVSSINSFVLIPFILCGLIIGIIMPLNVDLNSLSHLSSLITPFILPIGIASIGMALGNYIMLNIIYAGSDVNKENLPYIMFLTGIVMSIAFLLVFKIVMPMCLPSAIKAGMDAAGSVGDIFESLF